MMGHYSRCGGQNARCHEYGAPETSNVHQKPPENHVVSSVKENSPWGRSLLPRARKLPVHLRLLREEGCQVLEKVEQSEFGLFGWVMDPEGNKVELWQPPEGQ